ncbi:MAG TPA: DNA polymerase III subunit delta' [Gammaproteobacteria bacterium]|nr:DNA polymerase III subunit delta' [Gammaproteobacteria bacterium]
MLSPYPWQAEAWQRLQAWRRSETLPHGLLLTGPLGSGKFDMARVFAQGLLCVRAVDGIPCGECQGCHWVEAGTHPDLRLITFEVDEKTGKTAKEIKIAQIRELIEFAQLKSHTAPLRIAIVHPAEYMNRNAANSLLKTLEEPPPATYLILIAHQPSRLPVTVRSRCQVLRLSARAEASAVNWLSRQSACHGIDPAPLLREHGPLEALRLLESGEWGARTTLLRQAGDLLRGTADPIGISSQWTRLNAIPLLACLESLLIDVARLKAAGEEGMPVHKDLLPSLHDLAKALDFPKLFDTQALIRESRQLLERGSNLREQDVLEEIALHLSAKPMEAMTP